MERLPEEIKTKIMLYTLSCPFKEELKNYQYNKWGITALEYKGTYHNWYTVIKTKPPWNVIYIMRDLTVCIPFLYI